MKGSIFFSIWAKKKKLVGQTPKLIHSRYAPADFPGLLLFFVEIVSDKVILDRKKYYLYMSMIVKITKN